MAKNDALTRDFSTPTTIGDGQPDIFQSPRQSPCVHVLLTGPFVFTSILSKSGDNSTLTPIDGTNAVLLSYDAHPRHLQSLITEVLSCLLCSLQGIDHFQPPAIFFQNLDRQLSMVGENVVAPGHAILCDQETLFLE